MAKYLTTAEAEAINQRLKIHQVPTEDGALTHDLHLYQSTFNQNGSNDNTPILLFIHGFGEHIGMFEKFIYDFQQVKDVDIFHYNQRHHGAKFIKPDKVAHLDMPKFCQDLLTIVDYINKTFPGRNVYLNGNSLGGLIILTSAIKAPYAEKFAQLKIAGANFENPYIQVHPNQANFFLKGLINVLGSFLPNVAVPKEIDTDGISNDPEWAKKIVADPLFQYKTSFGVAKKVIANSDDIFQNLAAWPKHVPYEIHLGGHDTIVDAEAGKKFYELTKNYNEKNQIRIYEDAKHSIKGESGHVKETFIKHFSSFLQ